MKCYTYTLNLKIATELCVCRGGGGSSFRIVIHAMPGMNNTAAVHDDCYVMCM